MRVIRRDRGLRSGLSRFLGSAIVLLWGITATLLIFPRFLFGDVLYFRDLHSTYVPAKAVIASSLRHGILPFWNPYPAGGVPLIAQPAYFPLDPSNLVFLLPGRVPVLFTGIVLLFYVLAYGLMVLFLKKEGLGILPAVTGGTAFAFSALRICESPVPHHLTIAAYGVFFLWAVFHSRRPLLYGTLAWGLVITGGSWERAMILGPVALAGGFVYGGKKRFFSGTGALILGTLLAAPAWIPVLLHTFAESVRSRGLTPASALVDSLGLHNIGSLFLPYGFVAPDGHRVFFSNLFANGFPLFGSLYLGSPVLFLAVFSPFHRNRKERIRILFWFVVAALGIVLAGGSHSPLFRLLWSFALPLHLVRYPIKYLWFTSLALPILAAYGLDGLLRLKYSSRFILFVSIILGTALPASVSLAGLDRHFGSFLRTYGLSAARDSVVALFCMAVVLLFFRKRSVVPVIVPVILVIDFLGAGGRFAELIPQDAYAPPLIASRVRKGRIFVDKAWWSAPAPPIFGKEARTAEIGRLVIQPSRGALWGVRHAQGANELLLSRRTRRYLEVLESDSASLYAPYLNFFAVRWRINHLDLSPPPPPPWVLAETFPLRRIALYENPKAKERVYLLEGTGAAKIVREDNNSVFIEVETETAATLVLADAWAPGWRAEVNGRARPIIPFLGFLRSVRVPPGRSQVAFRYLPPGWRVSLLASAGAVGLLFLLLSPRLSRGGPAPFLKSESSRRITKTNSHRERGGGAGP